MTEHLATTDAADSTGHANPTLAIEGLTAGYRRRGVLRAALHDIDLAIAAGEAYGLVGESGCGKSTLALAAMRYLPRNGEVVGGSIRFDGLDLIGIAARRLRSIRGAGMAMVYQDPGAALNPGLRVADHIAEVYHYHRSLSYREGRARALTALREVAFVDPDAIADRYPHQLSGGQQQRVMIAVALAGDPRLLIMDEPTSGLDATTASEILELVQTLRRERRMSLLLISHDLSVVSRVCDRVGVLYAGRIVEQGATATILRRPRHPYTAALLGCVPTPGQTRRATPLIPIAGTLPPLGTAFPGCPFVDRCPNRRDRCTHSEPALEHGLRCFFPISDVPTAARAAGPSDDERDAATEPASGDRVVLRVDSVDKSFGAVEALRDVSLEIRAGETYGLVGESGSGKTTLGRIIVGLDHADAGSVSFGGEVVAGRVQRRTMEIRRAIQMVFQRPDSTLNPRRRARSILARAVHKLGGSRGPEDLAAEVRLEPSMLDQRVSSLSGGMRQRVAIARAFAGHATLVVCDEPTSALDVSVQAAVLNLLGDLSDREHVAYLFISHDLAAVRYLSDRVGVLYAGALMEQGPAQDVLEGPHHPYTASLLTARAGQQPVTVPAPAAPLAGGCPYWSRCPHRMEDRCRTVPPPTRRFGEAHVIRCHLENTEMPRATIHVNHDTVSSTS